MNDIITNFTTQIQTGSFSFVLLTAAFAGGVLSSLSPCTIGILPIIVGYIGGYDRQNSLITAFIQLLSFVFGLSVIMTIIGIFCALTGQVFLALGGMYWVIFIGSLILIFGLNLLGVVEIPNLNIIKRMPKSKGASLFIYPFILGFLFALASTPCSTPILASIMSFASLTKNILYSSFLLLLFSLGQGVIIILAGVFTSFVKNIKGVNKYSGYIMKFCGVLLVLSALYIYYRVFSPFFIK